MGFLFVCFLFFFFLSVPKNWHGLSGDREYPAQEKEEKGRVFKLYLRLIVEIQTQSSKGLLNKRT